MLHDEQKLELARGLLKYLRVDESSLPTFMKDMDDSDDPKVRTVDELLLAHFNEDSLFSIKTVRFLKDFSNYNAGYDFDTTNRSFVKLATIYKKMGIKNYYFFLQLNNPLLKGVDPYDPNISEETKLMIFHECRQNFWYFLREVLRVGGGSPFLASRANIAFIWGYLCHVNTMLIIPRQFGKFLRNSAKIKTPDGWTTHGEAYPGQTITMPDGTYAKIKNIFPQGVKDIYKITFRDGRVSYAGDEHLWKVWDAGKGGSGIWRVMTTLECKQRMTELKRAKNHLSVPLVEPDLGPDKKLPMDPWLLGVLLGDGGLSSGEIQIHKPDTFIFDKVSELVSDRFECRWRDHKTFAVVRKDKGDGFRKQEGLKDLLGLNSWEKFIPANYLEGSFKQRLAVLQGLLDTDGFAGKGGNVEYTTTSPMLAEGVRYLAHSIGAICSVKELQGKYRRDGEQIITRKYFRLSIRYTKPWDLFTLPRKRDRLIDKTRGLKFNSKLSMVSIELHSKEEATCIEVDHPDHLYITDDYIVTHNTVSAQSIIFWLQYIVGKGYESHLITLKDDNRSQFIEALKTIRNTIPSWMTNVTYRDKDAGNSLSYSAFGEAEKNILRIGVPQIGLEAARNVGRGLTVKTRFIDEPAYIKHMEAILNGAGPSTLTARANARKAGEPFGTGFITTPASTLTESGKYMYDQLMAATEFREEFFDCFSETHLYKVLIDNSNSATLSPTLGIVFNYMQLGRNRDWIKQVIDDLKLSLSEAKIDLLLMWDDNGKGKLFDDITRDSLNNGKAGRTWSQKMPGTDLFFDWYVSQEYHAKMLSNETGTYFGIGCDTSAAVNKDACTLVIRDLSNGKVVGTGRYPLANLMDVGSVIETLLVEIESSILVPERNYAHHMIDQLLRSLPALGIDPFKRIFNQIYQNPVKYSKEMLEIRNRSFSNRNDAFYLQYKQHFGFITGPRTREELYGFIQEAVGTTGDKIYYTKLIDEICELKEKNGRIDHDQKGHDDLVIAWLLTFWFMKLGESKSEYGIPPGIVMSRMSLMQLGNQETAQVDAQKEARIKIYKSKLDQLTEQLMKANDPVIIERLELMADKIQALIPADVKRSFNIDDIKSRAKEARTKRQIENRRKFIRY